MKKKGKILRIKTGYNPNSSSMGSLIPTFLFLAGMAGALTVFITAMFQKANSQIRKNKDKLEPVSEHKASHNETTN